LALVLELIEEDNGLSAHRCRNCPATAGGGEHRNKEPPMGQRSVRHLVLLFVVAVLAQD
jgi:hypothetical protein